MHSFTYHNPTRIIFGVGELTRLGAEAGRYGKRPLLVTGGASLKKNGLYTAVLDSLSEYGLDVAEFSGVSPNPTLSHLRAGIEAAKLHRADVIVAVGGGSVIDEAKGIAAGARMESDIWEFLRGAVSLADAIPVVAAPTVSAAGSEMNGVFVITNDDTRAKNGVAHDLVRPKVSVLDPSATVTLPLSYTALAAVDIVSHATEGYLTQQDDTPLQDGMVEAVVRTVMDCMERLKADPQDVTARGDMMWASTIAWNFLLTAGIGPWAKPCHMLGHPISALYDTPHGATLSIVTPAWMRDQAGRDPRRIALFARRVFGVTEADDTAAALAGADALRGWHAGLGAPGSFVEAGIDTPDLDGMAERSMAIAAAKGDAGGWTQERIKGILQTCA